MRSLLAAELTLLFEPPSTRVSSRVFNELVMSSSISMSTALTLESFCICSWSSDRLVLTKLFVVYVKLFEDFAESPADETFESRLLALIGEVLAELELDLL